MINYNSTRPAVENDLKVGAEFVANWNLGQTIIVEIRDGLIYYKCPHYSNTAVMSNTVAAFLKCFTVEIKNENTN